MLHRHPAARYSLLTLSLLGLGLPQAQAAGFALIEQNASGLGNAYAGQAASAQDASTIFFNPAGLTKISGTQVVAAGHLIMPSAKFTNTGSTLGGLLPSGGDAGLTAVVPNGYFAMDLGKDMKAGVGVNAPFGLATEYSQQWMGQTQGIRSDMATININPTLAWKVNDRLSLGLGINWQHIEAELTQSTTAPAVTLARMKGDDQSWGWNAGAMFQITPATRVGLAYRGEVRHRLEGDLNGNGVYADVALPATASLSLSHDLDKDWNLLADLTWTGWHSFEKLEIRLKANNAIASLVDEGWDDTLRASIGVSRRYSDKWTFRGGVAYDPTPVQDAAHRTVRIPDADRTWIAVGAQYRLDSVSALDFGYAHLFVNDARIQRTEAGVTVAGDYSGHVDILSVQYTRNF